MTRPLADVEYFEALYRRAGDPWNYHDSWYERRKYAITLASLPRARYRLAWEPACSIGVLTRALAGRADRVLASDASPSALEKAALGVPPERPEGDGRIEWSLATLPGPLPAPAGAADLVVLSEILYYLGAEDRAAVLASAHEVLAPGGDLVVVHWRPRADDAHLSGDEVNAWVRARPGWFALVRHDDEAFVLDVLRRR
jgi:SAM-dependent methyltransferase